MAQDPYSPIPTVAPEFTPAPQRNLNVPPNAFGANIGQAAEQAGQQGERAGEAGMQAAGTIQNLYNESAINAAIQKQQNAASDLLYKPETTPGAGDGGYFTMRGLAAAQNHDTAVAALNKSRDDIAASLSNPVQRNAYLAQTSRMHNFDINDMGRHADQQSVAAAQADTQGALEQLSGQAVATAANNGPRFDEYINLGEFKAQHWGNVTGYGQNWGAKYAAQWVGHTVTQAAETKAEAGDVPGAMALVAHYQDRMDPASLLAVRTRLNARVQDLRARSTTQNWFYGTSPDQQRAAAGPTPQANALLDVIARGESPGYNVRYNGTPTGATFDDLSQHPNIPAVIPGGGQTSTAAGRYQLLNTTWQTQAQKLGLTDFGPASQDKAAWSLATETYQDKTGRSLQADLTAGKTDLIPGALGGVWPSLKNASPEQISAGLANAAAAPSVRAATKLDLAGMLARVPREYPNDPVMQQKLRAEIMRQYANLTLVAQAQAIQQKAQDDAAQNEYVTAMMQPNADMNGLVTKIAADPRITDPKVKENLWEVAERHGAAQLDRDNKTYGPGFWDAYKRVTAAQGDPTRIADPNAVLQMALPPAPGVPAPLTLAGVKELQGVISQKGTEQGEANTKLQAQFFSTVKQELSSTDPTLKTKDPRGDEIFLHFMQIAFPQIQTGIAKGESIGEITAVNGPLWKTAMSMKRSLPQRIVDMKAAAGIVRSREDLISDYRAAKTDAERAALKDEALKSGYIRPDAPPAPEAPLLTQ